MVAHSRSSLGELVYTTLRERIVQLKIMPGSRIDVGSLAEEFSTSTMPVRDALKRLTERQLVVYQHGAGYRVVELTTSEIKDAFKFRKVIEVALLPTAITSVPKPQVLAMRDDMQELRFATVPQAELRSRFDTLDDALHRSMIVESSGNRFARMAMEVTHDFLAIARHLNERIAESLEEHIEILDAWLLGNKGEASRLLTLHLDNSQRACLPIPYSPHSVDECCESTTQCISLPFAEPEKEL